MRVMADHRVGECGVTMKMTGFCLCIEGISTRKKATMDISHTFKNLSHSESHLAKGKPGIMYPQTVLKLEHSNYEILK